ncbi:MAG: hypothetical protein WCA98_06405 [Candidatus Acidiferrales bacterium]
MIRQPGTREHTRLGSLARGLVALSVLFLSPAAVYAQGCPLCYQSAGARMFLALKHGIIIMMLPPLLITVGLARLAYRKRNLFNEEPGAGEGGPDEAPDEF